MTTTQPTIALDAERSVLGGILITCDTWAPEAELLRPGHFSCPVRARIFEAMLDLYDAGEPVDTLTTMAALKSHRDPPGKGWATYLAELAGVAPTAANLGHHAKLVLRESRRRDYLGVMTDAVTSASTPGADADEIATSAALRLGRIADGRQAARPVGMRDLVQAELAALDERRNSGTPVGHPTGFPDLDQLICGLIDDHLIILAGRPSMGKSTLARNILIRLGAMGVHSLLFLFESGESEITRAAIAAESSINLQKIRTARLGQGEYEKVVAAMARLHNNTMAVVDQPGMSIAEIRAVTRAYATRHPLGVVVVDYMQLAIGRGETREQEVASVSRGLKALGKEMHVPVIALSQLNRGLESRPDKRPRLSDLRESGSIEQDADEILFLYRDEYYNPGTSEPGIAEVGVAKSRNGPTGMVKLRWIGEYTKFESLNQETREMF